jgi:hypothetical protein
MAKFRVAVDGEYEEEFDNLADAVAWAQEVSLAGPTTWVVEQRRFSSRFRAAFPGDRTEEAIKLWKSARREKS